jgi:hypothetical protein
MSVTSQSRSTASTRHTRPATIKWLAALLGLLTVGALQGGIAMVVDPLEPLGMPVSYLDGTPIDDYVLPGLFLLGIAAACLITIAGLLFRWDWKWAAPIEKRMGHRWPWLAALATGGVLLIFEIIELFLVPFHPVMHPLLIVGSLAIIALVLTPSAGAYLKRT